MQQIAQDRRELTLRKAGELRVGVRVAQDEPFDKFLARQVADRLLDDGRFIRLGPARQIDRVLDRREVAREWRRGRGIGRRCRLAPRRIDVRHMPTFFRPGIAMMPRARCLMRLGVPVLLLAGERCRIAQKCGEHRQGEQTSQRPEALVHSVVPLRTNHHEPRDRTIGPVARRVPHGRFATVTFRQQRGKNADHDGTNRTSRRSSDLADGTCLARAPTAASVHAMMPKRWSSSLAMSLTRLISQLRYSRIACSRFWPRSRGERNTSSAWSAMRVAPVSRGNPA